MDGLCSKATSVPFIGRGAEAEGVGYSYRDGVYPSYACDNDWDGGARGQLADYAGEYCEGGRLDWTWAWTDGVTCSHRGQDYEWGFALR